MRRTVALVSFMILVLAAAGAAQPSRGRGERTKPSRSSTESLKGSREISTSRDATARDPDAEAKLSEIQSRIPSLSGTQQSNLQSLEQSLKTLGNGAKNAEQEIRQLGQDLQGMAIQAPDPVLVQQLATDLQAALADSTMSRGEIAQLTQDVNAVLNSANLSQSDLQVLIDDMEAILTTSGVGKAEIEAVVRDLQAIYDAAQGSGKSSGSRRSRPRGGS